LSNAIYLGDIRHRRFAIKAHRFNYPLYMLWIDLNNVEQLDGVHNWVGTRGFKALKYNQSDYLKNELDPKHHSVTERAHDLLAKLGVTERFDQVYMLGQVRCFGVYFSPVNFYFFGHSEQQFNYMVAEVSNTPWNERHYYLVPLQKKVNFKKVFSVSPFMDLDMNYHWQVQYSSDSTLIHIENKRGEELLFDASLRLKRHAFTKLQLTALLKRFPAMTWIIFKGIYVQAFKLFIKKVPFLGHA
jgi:DUF1365 family protein